MRTMALWAIGVTLGMAQQHQAPSAEKPVVLYKGLGIWRHPISATNAEAQKFFDQGLTLLYGFNRYEALRSFRKAAELDPRAAMAYWGLAMAQAPHINMDLEGDVDLKASCANVQAGLKIAGAAGRERGYLEAAATRCPEGGPQAYIAAMKALAARYPDDLDALTLYAESLMVPVRWRWYANDGTPADGTAEAERVLEQVLRRWPEHPGANHFYIHAVESSRTPERAIPSAQRLMGAVPAAGHLVHMPGHIWLVLGEYELAAAVNERAAEVDRQYMAASKVTASSYGGYYVHNLHFIAYARWMQGRKPAIKAADELAAAMAPFIDAMPEMADAFLTMPLFARARLGAWDEILKTPRPKDTMPAQTAIWHYARVLALAARGDQAAAAQEQAAFDAARAKLPADRPWGNNKAGDVMALAGEIVAARMAPGPAAAVAHWQKAVAMQEALVYDEPPAWYYPVHESLGAALLRAEQPAAAEAAFREGLRRSPKNGRMLFGLMESLKAQGASDGLEEVKREFEAAWSKADVKLAIGEM